MVLMRAEVFFVRRTGTVFAEPTGGTSEWIPCPDPQRWWAATAAASAAAERTEVRDDGRAYDVEIDVCSALPDHGSVGQVVRVLGRAPERIDHARTFPSDVDAVYEALARVPDSWLPYEVRVSEKPGSRLDAFVGTLFSVSPGDLRNALGEGWADLIRVEPWLRSQ